MGRIGSERLRGHLGQDQVEKAFAQALLAAGFLVENSPSIRAPHPVADKYGRCKKKVTVPDFFVTDPESGRKIYVEITKGSGNLPSKEAQQRVVKAAGVENYVQVTGDQVEALFGEDSEDARRALALVLFGWSE